MGPTNVVGYRNDAARRCREGEEQRVCRKWGGNTHCGPHRAVDLLLASSVGGETKAGREAYLWDPRMSFNTETTRLGDVERVRNREW